MAMQELPFGLRVSDSFITMLKEGTAECRADWPGALPCLVLAETCRPAVGDVRLLAGKRITFDSDVECEPVNRIAQCAGPATVNERVWGVAFDGCKYPAHMTFMLAGVEVHIDEQAQALLAGTALDFV